MFCLGQDIIHCHDWSSAPVAWLFKDQYMHYGLTKARVVFTIHNLEFGAQLIAKAMLYSDKATTVSNFTLFLDIDYFLSFIRLAGILVLLMLNTLFSDDIKFNPTSFFKK